MAKRTCWISTICKCRRRASTIASFKTLFALSLSAISVVKSVLELFSFCIFSSSCALTSSLFMRISANKSLIYWLLSFIIPSSKCSGPIDPLASLRASALLKARISDTLGENWLVIIVYLSFIYIMCNCLQTLCQLLEKGAVFCWIMSSKCYLTGGDGIFV